MLVMLAAVISLPSAVAQSRADADSITGLPVRCVYTFKPAQVILPVALFTVGAGLSASGLNTTVNDAMVDLHGHRGRLSLDEWIQYTPYVAYVGLGFIPGVKSRYGIRSRLLAGATGYLVMTAITQGLKGVVNEPRPNGGKHSFPSGHTATAFLGAELLRIEYGTYAAIGGYAVAAGTAFLRLYNHYHWLNDVLAGAGIGILSARVAYWLLPLEQKLLKFNDLNVSGAIVPSYDPLSRTAMLSAAFTF